MWMLLHGFMGSSRSWERVVPAGDRSDDAVAPSLMGHGRDWQRSRVGSFEEEVTRLLAIARTWAGPRYVCGYSMGARVALGMLSEEPELFDGAVLIGVHPGLDDARARAERRAIDAARARVLRSDGLVAFVDTWESQPLFASQRKLSPEVLAQQRAIRLDHDPEGLAASLEVLGLGEMPSHAAAFTSLAIPVTLMAGGLDTKFATIVQHLSSGAHPAHLVDGVGHNVLLEAPRVVATALRNMEQRFHG